MIEICSRRARYVQNQNNAHRRLILAKVNALQSLHNSKTLEHGRWCRIVRVLEQRVYALS